MNETDIRKAVREAYARTVKQQNSCCDTSTCGCCSSTSARDNSRRIGYSDTEIDIVPEGSNLGLGCGNPTALASLKEGETVLDLGYGAGFDCFIAAGRVGKNGKVIGVDMTPEMLEKARENATKGGYTNVEFRLAEIENLPVTNNSVDVIISNCVINLSTDKPQVFREAYRVLKPGGRLMVSDIILTKTLPAELRNSMESYANCIAGASLKSDYLDAIEKAGFKNIEIVEESTVAAKNIISDFTAKMIAVNLEPTPEKVKDLVNSIKSIMVSSIKPK